MNEGMYEIVSFIDKLNSMFIKVVFNLPLKVCLLKLHLMC